ncbi:hypothetical protein D9M68_877950 [compost metagenome]
MAFRFNHTSSPVPTSALWRDLWKVAAASMGASPSSGRTASDASEKGFCGTGGPSTWKMRTMGMPAAWAPSMSAFCAAR